MNTLILKLSAGLLACLFSWNALADGGRECILDLGSGVYLPPNGAGACFGDLGFLTVVFDASNGGVVAGNPPGDNQWFLNAPNGNGRFHAATDVVFLFYCSLATLQSGACFPGSEEAFLGEGEVVLNSQQQGLVFTCPLTSRINGTAMDGFGNMVEVTAALTTVPLPGGGCGATVASVEATPVIE